VLHSRAKLTTPFLTFLFLSLAGGCGSTADVPIDEPGTDTGGTDSASVDTAVGTDTNVDPETTPPDPDTGSTTDSRDTAIDPTDTFVDPDTGVTDTGVIVDTAPGIDTTPGTDTAPGDCSSTALAVDPASSLDALTDGPLKVAHTTVVVPTLGPLTSVNVKIHYPVLTDGVTPHPGRHAWVMFHHAVHGPYPGITYDRYNGTFDRWASHGIITFSIDGHLIFFPSSSGSGLSWAQQGTVAGMMDQAITYFLAEQEKSTFVLKCALDKDRVGVSGHSRGGGAAELVKTTRTDGAKIKAYVGFQPVNPEITSGAPAPPATVPIFDVPSLWFDAGNDGDVIYPITAMLYSHTRNVGSHVTILGGKHTYTLDTPTPDQGGPAATITPDEQKRVQAYYGVPFLRAFLRDATPAAADLLRVTGSAGLSVAATVSTGDATLRWCPPSSYSSYLEKFDETLGTTPTTTPGGGAITLFGGMTATSYETYTTSVSTWGTTTVNVSRLLRSVRLNWGTTDGYIDIPIPAGATTGKSAFVFETAWPGSPTVTSGTHPLYMVLTDTTGASSTIALKDVLPVSWSKRPRRLSGAYVPFTKFTGVDITKAKSVRFLAKAGTASSDILFDLLRLE